MTIDEFLQGAEILPNFHLVVVKRQDAVRYSHTAQQNICFCIDDELLYEPFYADFGPLNLGKTYRFCQKANQLLQEAERLGKRLFVYTGPHAHHKANTAVLVGLFQVIYLNRTADEAYRPLAPFKPFVPFRDASCGVSTFHLTVYDCLKGIQKARDVGFIDWNSGSSTWNLEEYEHYEQVENGDLNWIVPGKFVAFSGPAARGNEIVGYRLHTPEDYWDYFRRKGVTTVVRLNKKVYDRKRFLDGGLKHHEMYFPDGSCPSDAIIARFLDMVEAEPGAIAVHCKAGLGRTGVLICSYIMKHYRFTAEEVIGYIRICRPGSVIGPQQNFMRELEARLWQEGEMYRALRGMPKAGPSTPQDLAIAGRAAGHAELGAAESGGSHYSAYSHAGAAPKPLQQQPQQQQQYHGPAPGSASGGPRGGVQAGASSSSSSATQADMSLLQYSRSNAAGGSHGHYYSGHGPAPPASAPSSGVASLMMGGGPDVSSASSSSSMGGLGGFRARDKYSPLPSSSPPVPQPQPPGRSMTPLRYGQAAGSLYGSASGAGASASGVSLSTPGGLVGSSGVTPRSGLMDGIMPMSRAAPLPGSVSASSPSSLQGPLPGGRSPSAARLTSLPASASALRATLHTDTLAAADRGPKALPERNTQSADISSTRLGGGVWKIAVPGSGTFSGGSGSIPTTPTTPPGGPRTSSSSGGRASGGTTPTTPSSGVARVLAPNGQPRKVPIALLGQYQYQGGASGGGAAGGLYAAVGPAPIMQQQYAVGMLGRQGSSNLLGVGVSASSAAAKALTSGYRPGSVGVAK